VIDNGDDYRMDDRVPLVIPEINPEALDRHQGFIANPNCSTIITLMGIAPLHKKVPLKHMTAVTFQSVSGTGRAAIEELEQQARAYATGDAMAVNAYPHQIAFNVRAADRRGQERDAGLHVEEAKMTFESRKILGSPECASRAPRARAVFYAHSIAIHAESARRCRRNRRARSSPAPKASRSSTIWRPRSTDAALHRGGDDVGVGRIRVDPSVENGLALWCCAITSARVPPERRSDRGDHDPPQPDLNFRNITK
jgi:aspartate-semialdehyde dehydrogenase